MKIALLTDSHWGIRNDSPILLDYNKKFLDKVFFPTLKEREIIDIIHLGDLVDRRKYININTAKRLREDFLEKLIGFNVDIIAGNHDVYYKNRNDTNSLRELINTSYPYSIHDSIPVLKEFDGTKILLVPWICDQNRVEVNKALIETSATIVMAHLELKGFPMHKGDSLENSHGDDPSIYKKFDLVFSGHYHHRSNKDNIYYLGSHNQYTWADYNDPKGFHIFDTQTRKLEFILNPYNLFEKIWYDDTDKQSTYPHSFDFINYSNKTVKVVIIKKGNPYWFDIFFENLQKAGPNEISITEVEQETNMQDDLIINQAEQTIDIVGKYIDTIKDTTVNKQTLKLFITELHEEAKSIE